MIKSIGATLAVMFIFFLGVNFALKDIKLSKELMRSTFGCEYTQR